MNRFLLSIAVEDAAVDALGAKECAVMALEAAGMAGARVLRVEVQEPEQLAMEGVAPDRSTQPKPPAPRRTAPPRGTQSTGRPTRPKSRPLASCYTCAHYRPSHGQDERGTLYWGLCANSGKPVYRLIDQCEAWRVMR